MSMTATLPFHTGRSAPSLTAGRRALRALGLTVLLVPAFGAPAAAQSIAGLVAEHVTLAPVRGAVVTAYQTAAGSDALEPVAVTRSDEDGYFELELPGAGTFRVQADSDGQLSPLSASIELGPEQSVDDLGLVVPSPLLNLAYACEAGSGEGFVTVVGVARDPEADVVLPDVRVEARWYDGSQTRILAGTSDAAGRYSICGLPSDAGFVQLQGQLLGRMSTLEEVELTAPTLVFHDVELTLDTRANIAQPNVIQERILLEAAARGLADLSGQLLDQFTGAPIRQAVVRIQGTPLQALTGEDGQFTFTGVQPGSYYLEIRHLGYNVESDQVDVPAGQGVFLRLQVAPQAVELAGIDVTTRSAVEEITRLTPFRRDIVYGETLLEEEERGARAFEVLRRSSPGIQVREIFREGSPPTVCVQSNRRVQSLTGDGCGMVQVVLDGTRISPDAASQLLRNLPAGEIESIEFLAPAQASILYGTAGNTSNGVVVIYTRGKGPYVSPLRNRRP
jgi:hypothetical protein